MKEKLEARKEAVEKEQTELSTQFESLKEQGAEISRKLSAVQTRFNGNVRVLNEIAELMGDDSSPNEAPSKKPTKQ